MSVFSRMRRKPANRTSSSHQRLRAAIRPVFPGRSVIEPLEGRRMLSVGINVSNGVLTIAGTEQADVIAINPNVRSSSEVATQWAVSTKTNGVMNTTLIDDPSAINRIVVNSGGGDDWVRMSDWIRTPAEIHGGQGNDIVTGGGRRSGIPAAAPYHSGDARCPCGNSRCGPGGV